VEVEIEMRLVGIVLILLGGLTLGLRGFETQTGTSEKPQEDNIQAVQPPWWHIPPVMSGIVLVAGLLLLASSERRDER